MSDRDNRSERTFLFGPFRLSTFNRALLEGDRVVRLGSKAIEILIALVERAGELVSKRELVEIAWPNTFVVEANLTVQVAALRRALGEDDTGNQYIVNSPGRGYRFVAPIKVLDGSRSSVEEPVAATKHNLPAQLTRLVGRAEALQSLKRKLGDGRLLSVVGPPGVGKTSIALRVAETMISHFRHGVWLIDLGSINSGSLVASALASALPVEVRSSDILSGITEALRYKHLLLLFDNCEHLIDETTMIVGEVLRVAEEAKVMTTSREPLRIEGEQVFRLSPLNVPPLVANFRPMDLLTYPAVQLFFERAAAVVNDFEVKEADAAYAAQICRGLDGNPLAIEMAAARVDAFGIEGVARRIADRTSLLADSHRGTPPRQRTIASALEWSYQLLSEREKNVLRGLGIFSGSFTLDAAIALFSSENDTATTLADLVCKSLISVDVGADGVRFRLLEITKAFVSTKLIERSELDERFTRLSAYFIELLNGWAAGPTPAQAFRGAVLELDSVRGILDWAFSTASQSSAAVALAVASVPIWLENSLLTECIRWTTKAIDAIGATGTIEPTGESERREMILKAAFGLAVMFTEGMTGPARAALNRSIELAERLNDRQWELRALLGLVVFQHRRGDMMGALMRIARIETLTAEADEPTTLAMTKSIKSASLYFRADYIPSLRLSREANEYFRNHSSASKIGAWGFNPSIHAQCVVARAHWTLGNFDQTIRACLSAHSSAEETGNSTWICHALSWCNCSLFLILEDLDRAAEAIKRFKQVAQDSNFQIYIASAIGYEGRFHFFKGNLESAEQCLREALARLGDAQYETVYIPFLGRLAEVLAADGRSDEALLASEESLTRTRATEAFWLLPDALRIHGEVLSSLGGRSQSAEAHLRESVEVAVQQKALGWELRSTESLAKILCQQGRSEQASVVLEKTLGRFVEGFDTVPFRRCSALLDELRKNLSERLEN